MDINNFTRFRINGRENFVDVKSCGDHCTSGVILTAYDFESERIEVRRKEGQTAMFVLKYASVEIPEYWRDAKIVFSNLDN